MRSAMKTVLAMPELVQSLEAQGVQVDYRAAEPFGRMIGDEMRQWSKVAQAAKVKID